MAGDGFMKTKIGTGNEIAGTQDLGCSALNTVHIMVHKYFSGFFKNHITCEDL